MFKRIQPYFLILASLLFIACGGSSSSEDNNNDRDTETNEETSTATTSTMTKITGSVPGTLIEAFCVDGSYYSTVSDQNGSLQHPFTLNIPSNLACHLVMTTNENDPALKVVTPIAFTTPDSNNTLGADNNTTLLATLENNTTLVTSVDTNNTSFVVNGTSLSLGYIDLALSPANIVDVNRDQVVDQPLVVTPIDGNITTIPPSQDIMDTDNDGIIDLFEDDDNDGISNREDHDDDNDGIDDNRSDDIDGDGIKNEDDKDDDNDGIEDSKDNDDDNNGVDDIIQNQDEQSSNNEENNDNNDNNDDNDNDNDNDN